MANSEKLHEFRTHELICPASGCDWSRTFEHDWASEEAAKVDGGIHWQNVHGGIVPDHAGFGEHQCPSCYAMDGFDGTVSCSECGHVPEKVRA